MGDLGSIAGLGRFPGEGNGYPLQYSCQKNSMDRGVSQATVHGVTESWTQLSIHVCTCAHTHTQTAKMMYVKAFDSDCHTRIIQYLFVIVT